MILKRRKTFDLASDESGGALIEFLFVVPVFVALIMGVFELGSLAAENSSVTSAASAGAQYHLRNPDSPNADVIQAVRDDYGVGGNTLAITLTTACECPESVNPVNCTSTCPTMPLPPQFLSVRVEGSYATSFNYPLINSPVTIVKQVTIRTR